MTKRKRTRRKKTTRMIGGRLAVLFSLFALCASGGDKKPPPEPSIVAGTVFRDPGFAMANAEVTLTLKTAPQGVKAPKQQKTTSNFRGEYSFRVPAAKAEYVVSVKASGFVPEDKPAIVGDDPERLEIYLTLKPDASKGK
jgi:Carboxypeptidase regulatory-like domain